MLLEGDHHHFQGGANRSSRDEGSGSECLSLIVAARQRMVHPLPCKRIGKLSPNCKTEHVETDRTLELVVLHSIRHIDATSDMGAASGALLDGYSNGRAESSWFVVRARCRARTTMPGSRGRRPLEPDPCCLRARSKLSRRASAIDDSTTSATENPRSRPRTATPQSAPPMARHTQQHAEERMVRGPTRHLCTRGAHCAPSESRLGEDWPGYP